MKITVSDSRFCAFLRGVNVQGTNMKMAEVCSVFSKAGMRDVSSVLASGNIIFSSSQNPEDLISVLADAMAQHFSYEAFLFVKQAQEIEEIVAGNPFEPETDHHVYCFIGGTGVENLLMSEFEKGEKVSGEKAQLVYGNFYWKIPKGSSIDSSFGRILGRKKLKSIFTSRNINTMERVLKRM